MAVGQTARGPATDVSSEAVAKQIDKRQSVQSLDATLGEIADKLIPVFTRAREAAAAPEVQQRISRSFCLADESEQRAKMLRWQLFELIERKLFTEQASERRSSPG